jgi:DNA-binding NarL/FixJ family response regulator
MPLMLRDILRGILTGQPDLKVIGEVADPTQLDATLERIEADVVILGSEGPAAWRRFEELLLSHPRLKVLDITLDGSQAFLHELRPHHTALGELSPDALLRAAR